MSRSIPVIYNQLLQQKNAQSALGGLNSTSQVSIWNLWLWITAVAQNLFEQLCDMFQSNIEKLILNGPAITAVWVVALCKYFQYSDTTRQVLQVNITPLADIVANPVLPLTSLGYPIINPALNVVSQAAVVTDANNQLSIKVTGAAGPLDGSPGITGPICSALISTLNLALPPNINYVLINGAADFLYIQADIYYNASYSGVIQTNVAAAITAYLQSLPFNGILTVSALEEAILAVAGVSDVVLNNVYWRKANDPAPIGGPPPSNMPNQLISGNTLISRSYQTYAGYVVPETTSGYALTDSLTFTPA